MSYYDYESNYEKCAHDFDGGICLECGLHSRCELCGKNPWEVRCDHCQSGRICDDCYTLCEYCNENICEVCQNNGKESECGENYD